jgi:geranylgeranyl pyrophosphate synthase
MTGGQSMDLAAEGVALSREQLRLMHALKTGALLGSCVMSACAVSDDDDANRCALQPFAAKVGLAFQIRDDILDVDGKTETIGKAAGSDLRRQKATWPSVWGIDESRRQCAELLEQAVGSLRPFGDRAASLQQLARYVVERAL